MTPPNSRTHPADDSAPSVDIALPPDAPLPAATPAEGSSALSPEEQMARFEQDLKETDWGHQPC